MKTKTLGVVLAAGVFVLALFMGWFSGERQSPLKREAGPAATVERAPVAEQPRANNPPPGTTQTGEPMVVPNVSPAPRTARAAGAQQTPSPESATDSSPGNPTAARSRDAQVDANKVHLMVRDYHTLMGENPVGTNAEIMQALMGHNPKQATVGPPEGMALNGKGELIDQWGTPYFFHQLSRDVMEIHSAGPDKVMGTADDVMVR